MDKEQKGSKSSLVREKVALPAVLRSLQNADIATDLKESRRKDSGPCRVTSVQQAITGAAIDITIATGGAGAVVFAAVTASGGVGGATSSYVNQRMNGISHEDVSWSTVLVDGLWGAAGAALTFGVADVGGPSAKTTSQILSQTSKKVIAQAKNDFLFSMVISSGTWVNAARLNHLIKQHRLKD